MNQFDIMVWAQMFFEDGSVSEGKRFPAEVLSDESSLKQIAIDFLNDLNRTEGFLVVWGAGQIYNRSFIIISPAEESDSLASLL